MKPFSTYPEDRGRLLNLSRIIQGPDVEAAEEAANELSNMVMAILSDEDQASVTARMSEDCADEIGILADRLDASLYSLRLPISKDIHIEGMSAVIRSVRNEIVSLVRSSLQYDPWEDQDFA